MKPTSLLCMALTLIFTSGGCERELTRSPGPTHDIAVTSVSAPSSCVQGDTVRVVAHVENRGSRTEALEVVLTDIINGKQIERKSVTLSAADPREPGGSADLVLTGENPGDCFGQCNCTGDVNGDGYDDVLIGTWGYDGKRGRAYLYYGGEHMDGTADKTFTGEREGDAFSDHSVCLADMNGDGFDDVIIGDRYFDGRGRVYVYWGGRDMDEKVDVAIDPEAGVRDSSFGRGIHAGDLNGDGAMDLVVSAVGFRSYTGRTYLFYGPIASDTVADKVFTGENIDDTFGERIATGDIDGDGCDDLILGTRYYPRNTGKGRVYLYYGGRGTTMDEECDGVFDAENPGDEFGCNVELFDMDNDGHADVLISARNWSRNQGRVYLYWGSSRATMDNIADIHYDGEPEVRSSLGGTSVVAGYINNDKYGDMVVAAYNYPRFGQQGRAYLFYGDARRSISTTYARLFTPDPARSQPHIAGLGDFNGDGYGDVITGGAEYGGWKGRCWLWYGAPDPSTDVTFAWDTTGASLGDHILSVTLSPVLGKAVRNIRTMTVSDKPTAPDRREEPRQEEPQKNLARGTMSHETATPPSEKPSKSLTLAAVDGDIQQVELHLTRSTDVNEKTISGDTALHYAARYGHTKVAELLIANGADVACRNRDWETPAHIAMRADHKEIVDLLVAKGATVSAGHVAAYKGDLTAVESSVEKAGQANDADEAGFTLLHAAACSGQKAVAEYLIGKGARVDPRDIEEQTPLSCAASAGHKDMVELLLGKGADTGARDSSLASPLHLAVKSGHSDIVALLSTKGADLNARNGDGQSPLDIALDQNRKAIVQLLLSKGVEVPSIHVAVQTGDLARVSTFLEKGTDIDAKDAYGLTPLHWAASGGHTDVAELLVNKGADVNARDSRGETPLHRVAMQPRPAWWDLPARGRLRDTAELLIAHGADVNAKSNDGATPLSLALKGGHTEIVELLCQHGTKEPPGYVEVLHAAARTGDLDRIKALIAKGVEINTPNTIGVTALHVAAGAGQREVSEFLIAKGADVGARAWNGDTPLHGAMQQGRTDVVKLLLDKGADANVQNSGGRTPLEDAVLRRHSEVVNLAVKHDLESTSPPAPRHDVSVTMVSAASPCRKGNRMPVTINVANQGTFRETLHVMLRDQTDGAELGRRTVALGKKWTGKADDIPDLVLKAGVPGADHMGNRVCIGGDANGDGYRDFLVCSPIWYEERGRAYLYYGGPRMDANADLVFEGQEAGCCLGNQSGTFADLNKDGCDDLIIGAPGRTLENEHDGYVNVYYGGSHMDAVPDVILKGKAGAKENFGLMVTTSDIDNDGYQDVLVGAQGYDGRGRVYLFWGGNPVDTTADVILDGEYFPEANPSAAFNKDKQPPVLGTSFGRRIDAGGDVNGDGYNDILVGARHAGGPRNNGCAYLFFGNSKGKMDGVCDWTLRGEDQNYQMGSSVDISDIDADGNADLLVGARGAVGYHGRVYIYWGARDFDGSHPGLILEAPTQSAMGGDYIECRHFNNDRYGDILVGAFGYPGTGYRYGRAYLFYGNAKTVMDANCDYLFGGECGTDNYFGCQVSAGDVNGDGYVDALIGEEGANQWSGKACLFYGPFHDTTDITFNWDTTKVSIGTHTLKVEIAPVDGETDKGDNTTTATVKVEAPY